VLFQKFSLLRSLLDWIIVNVPNFDSKNMVICFVFKIVVAFRVFGSLVYFSCTKGIQETKNTKELVAIQ
jgi:hypothetical protein